MPHGSRNANSPNPLIRHTHAYPPRHCPLSRVTAWKTSSQLGPLCSISRTALSAEIQAELADDLPFHWIETLPTNQVYITDLVNNPPLTIWGNMSPMHEVWLTQ